MAVGGGSVLDVAKLIGLLGPSAAPWRAFLAGGGTPDQQACRYRHPHHGRQRRGGDALLGLLRGRREAIDLASATAAEPCDRRSAAHPQHVPALTAPTGLDALAQAIESFWAVGATPESQALAEAAIGEIMPSLREAVRAPTPVIRERMSRGAHLAGQAIDISRTTAAHALS